ncbi:hypothetical protein [Streptomyces ochraceiscleroticus]|uniref:Uncharacterized protein n=1 Tax=Streptomyces ochraceiscleroticus TaxID=47761 RepID=A0ABW1MJM5_9ACTN|nr:hypothetical protein [Streptomyces ochraceiscleroticus]
MLRNEKRGVSRRYVDVLGTPPDGAFDRIAALAAHLFGPRWRR